MMKDTTIKKIFGAVDAVPTGFIPGEGGGEDLLTYDEAYAYLKQMLIPEDTYGYYRKDGAARTAGSVATQFLAKFGLTVHRAGVSRSALDALVEEGKELFAKLSGEYYPPVPPGRFGEDFDMRFYDALVNYARDGGYTMDALRATYPALRDFAHFTLQETWQNYLELEDPLRGFLVDLFSDSYGEEISRLLKGGEGQEIYKGQAPWDWGGSAD